MTLLEDIDNYWSYPMSALGTTDMAVSNAKELLERCKSELPQWVSVEDGVESGQYEMMVRVVCMDGDGNLATEKEYPLTVRVPSAEIGLPAPGPSIWMAITVLILVVAIKVRGDGREGRQR